MINDSYRRYICTRKKDALSASDSYRKYICRSNKDAESASWFRFCRACERKIYQKMYTVDGSFNTESIANHRKVASYGNKASVGGIQK